MQDLVWMFLSYQIYGWSVPWGHHFKKTSFRNLALPYSRHQKQFNIREMNTYRRGSIFVISTWKGLHWSGNCLLSSYPSSAYRSICLYESRRISNRIFNCFHIEWLKIIIKTNLCKFRNLSSKNNILNNIRNEFILPIGIVNWINSACIVN